MVITSTIGNRVAANTARGFESLPLRQKKAAFLRKLLFYFAVKNGKPEPAFESDGGAVYKRSTQQRECSFCMYYVELLAGLEPATC